MYLSKAWTKIILYTKNTRLLTNTLYIFLTVSGVARWSSLIWSFWHFWQYNWLLLYVEWDYVLVATHNVVLMAKTLVDHSALPVPESVNFCETWICLPWWVWAWALQQSSGSSTQIPTRLELPGQFLFRPNPYRQISTTLEIILNLKICDTTSKLCWINYLFDSINLSFEDCVTKEFYSGAPIILLQTFIYQSKYFVSPIKFQKYQFLKKEKQQWNGNYFTCTLYRVF